MFQCICRDNSCSLSSAIQLEARVTSTPLSSLQILNTLRSNLAQVAGRLEVQIRGGLAAGDFPVVLAQLQFAVDATLQSLVPVLQRSAPTPPQAEGMTVTLSEDLRSALRETVCALMIQLHDSNMGALRAYAEMRDRHGATLGASLNPLGQAIADLEFETASRCCDALLAGVLA